MAKEIEIETRIGRRVIDPETIIHFPRGLAGFEEAHDFILLPLRPDAPMRILQSVEKPEVGLLVADPYSFLTDIPVSVGDAERKLLGIDDVSQAAVLVTVSIPPGSPQDATLNLTGPIVINSAERVGLQNPQGIEDMTQIRLRDLEKLREKGQPEQAR